MTHDELRKRCFELESALGTAMKIAEQQRDEMNRLRGINLKLTDVSQTLIVAIKSYIATMNKKYLLDVVDQVQVIMEIKKHQTVTE